MVKESQKNISHKHYIGHRQRLKNKFLESENLSVFADYELLELLLFFSVPRKDVKPLAKELLVKIGSLQKILNSEHTTLLSFFSINNTSLILLKLVKEIIARVFKNEVSNKNVISSWNELLKYLKFTMSDLSIEYFRVIF